MDFKEVSLKAIQTVKPSLAIDITLDDTEQHLKPIIEEFNELCAVHYPVILRMTHYELAKLGDQKFSIATWRDFLTNPKISEWYTKERDIIVRSKILKMLDEIDKTKSTAIASSLSALLKQEQDNSKKGQSTTKYIYSFIPLTEMEKKAPNVRILETIPRHINNALERN